MATAQKDNLDTPKSLEGELFFISHNPSASETIVLLHGAFSSHLEWEHVASHLKDFHLLIPDLPQHSGSRNIGPFNLNLAAEKVANLVRAHAHGGKAHVVGLSLGGFVTQEIIRRYPDTVLYAFITGCTPFNPTQQWFAARAGIISWGLWAAQKTGLEDFAAWKAGLLPYKELKKQIALNNSNGVARSVYPELGRYSWDDVEEAAKKGKRILVCAGEQMDDVPATKRLADIYKKGERLSHGGTEGGDSQGFVVKNAIHGWDLQLPELFARAIIAWIRLEPIPSGFESLGCLETN
jgi:pimeloyl-ACP methyl ester carboxylesterase